MAKNQNKKSKHWQSNLQYHQILNWKAKLKRKIKFSKKKIQNKK